jgi:hypothetical protein
MREKKTYKPTSLRIDPTLYQRAKRIGQKRKWSTHQTLIEAFRVGLEKFEKEDKKEKEVVNG